MQGIEGRGGAHQGPLGTHFEEFVKTAKVMQQQLPWTGDDLNFMFHKRLCQLPIGGVYKIDMWGRVSLTQLICFNSCHVCQIEIRSRIFLETVSNCHQDRGRLFESEREDL